MNSVPHEFVTVDMRGLKAALIACARERKVSVSAVVRDAVAGGPLSGQVAKAHAMPPATSGRSKLKLSIRFSAEEVARLDAGAKAAGFSRGAFLSGLVDGVSVLSSGRRSEHVAALIASNAELSTLTRNLRHLATLLGRSELAAAQKYRSLLDTIADDVDRHLRLAGETLKAMRPRWSAQHPGTGARTRKARD